MVVSKVFRLETIIIRVKYVCPNLNFPTVLDDHEADEDGDVNETYEDSEDEDDEDDDRKPAAESSVDANSEPEDEEEFGESSLEGDY